MRIVIAILTAIFLPYIALGALLYVYDPLQIYHKPFFREATFYGDRRLTAPGLIKNYEFDGVILGTSMLENTTPQMATRSLGGKWMNLSLSGSSYDSRRLVLEKVLQKGGVKHIIYSLDYTSGRNSNIHSMPSYLFSENKFEQMRFYVNKKFIACALVFSTSESCVGLKKLEDVGVWAKNPWHTKRFGGFENWIKEFKRDKNHKQLKPHFNDFKRGKTYTLARNLPAKNAETIAFFEENLLKFARQSPQVKFSLVVPTYSLMMYRFNRNLEQFFADRVAFVRYILEAGLPNVEIVGFDDTDYASEIKYYKDYTHYDVNMNQMQLDAIKSGEHRITKANLQSYFATQKERINGYDVSGFIKKAKEMK